MEEAWSLRTIKVKLKSFSCGEKKKLTKTKQFAFTALFFNEHKNRNLNLNNGCMNQILVSQCLISFKLLTYSNTLVIHD